MMQTRSCSSCGQALSPFARFCARCGAEAAEPPVAPPPGSPPIAFPAGVQMAPSATYAVPPGWTLVRVQHTPGSATASLVLGIVTWALLLFGIGIFTWWITAPLAVALGVAGRTAVDADPDRWTGRSRATTGMWLGLSFLAGATFVVSLIVWFKAADL